MKIKKTGLIIALSGFLLQTACTFSSIKKKKNNDNTKSHVINIYSYRDSLQRLSPDSPSSSLHALKLFRQKAVQVNPDSNDVALKVFLDFQNKLIDSLNRRLIEDKKISSQLNSLAFLDSSLYEPEDLEFEKKLEAYGFKLRRAEGSVFLISNADLVKHYFNNSLSDSGKEFLSLYEKDLNQPFAADAALLISVKELGQRVVSWEKFAVNYPKSPFRGYSQKQFERYLYFLLAGLDNTPAFRNGELSEDFHTAYISILNTYPGSETSNVLQRYMNLLKQHNYRRSPEVQSFLNSYNFF